MASATPRFDPGFRSGCKVGRPCRKIRPPAVRRATSRNRRIPGRPGDKAGGDPCSANRKGRPAPMPNPVSGPGRGCATGDNRFFPGAREPSPPSPMGRPSGRPRVFDGMTPEEAVIRPSRGGGELRFGPACQRRVSTWISTEVHGTPRPLLQTSRAGSARIPTSAWSLFTLRPTLPASFPDGTSPAPVSRRTRVHRHTERFP